LPKQRLLRPKLLRSNPHHALSLVTNDEDDGFDDWELMPFYRRRDQFDLVMKEIDDMELSDEIKFRLMLIRLKALGKRKEIYYNSDV